MVGDSLEEEPLRLRTTLWALAGSPSLEARVTSMKSAVCKGGANGKREVEGLVLAGQRLAEIHALGGQRRIH